jgi:uncharacterized damage-inducible protein DinB
MMSEVQRVVDQLRRAFEGDAFHGESINEILRRVTAVQANRRPIKQAHSIWELVHHIAGWNGEISNRLKGQAARLLPPEQNFPDQKDTSEAAWKKTLQKLEQSYQELSTTMQQFPESRLTDTVPGRKFNFYVLIHGIVQHTIYHAGQIAILKKST